MITHDTIPCPPPGEDRDTLVVPMLRELPAGFLYLQPFCAIASPVAVTRADRCHDCGRIAMSSVEQWDEAAQTWRTRAACCGAERDELGCRLEDS